VHGELEVIDATEVRPGQLYLAETASLQSALALAMLGPAPPAD
jgi:hypothetical protein